MNLNTKELLASLESGFISKEQGANSSLMPSLLVNDSKQEKKILSDVQQELSTCNAFDFSVAFITPDGLASIMQTLEYLREHNVKGRILTTNYLNFTHPGALSKILEFPNIELRSYTKGGFHPKGYIFKQSNYYSIIIGSANLTSAALAKNQEWSIKFLSCLDGQIVFSVREEFERVWGEAEIVTPEWIEEYSKAWNENRVHLKQKKNKTDDENEAFFEADIEDDNQSEIKEEEELEIIPNTMQQEAMASLDELRSKGENKALLIAATGTGKTYLSIFDVLQVKPKKVLYVAHRDMILNKSEQSFRNLLPNIKTGFLNGTQRDLGADYLFASIFTLAKDETLKSFAPDYFDYIIVDEVHHAGASSYKKIIDYFKPKFMLGLTATPERTDGADIFQMFDNNIAYEIRLQKALESELLCPFHYYGLSDITVNNEEIDDKSDFTKLVASERIKHIEHAIKLYKNNAVPVKGLIFCSRVDEAKELSNKLNNDGFCTTYLTGENSDEEREVTIDRLESDDDPLQYIISVDIFNEGVDIPAVNQVVMLRPTQSAIIFVQQLGRGLRKAKDKSYVSVIDFIGNYENNFFIPIALYGDNSYNKDNIRKALSSGSAALPGTSTIQINEVAKQRIFDSISQTNFKQLKLLKTEYEKLKMRYAKVPTMMDFVNNGFIDPFLFIDYSGSYYEFKLKMKEIIPELSSEARKSLQFLSMEFARGIRLHELLILSELINKKEISLSDFENELLNYNVKLSKKDLRGMLKTLSPDFYVKAMLPKYGTISYVSYDENKKAFVRTNHFEELLSDENYKKEVVDCLEYGIKRATLKDSEKYVDDNLVLYRKYSRKDVCKLLNWNSDCSSTIYGYKTETSYEEYTCPIFVTYHKDNSISDTTKYNDVFIDNTKFSWMSRSRRTSSSEEVAKIIDQENNDIKVLLFVKKDDGEGTDFYYLGNMNVNSYRDTTMTSESGAVSVVNIQFNMENPLPQNIYNYLES